MIKSVKKIGLLGGGPSALFMYKRLVDLNNTNIEVHIFERSNSLGTGMPYSSAGASDEHITNVSGNEIPEIVTSVEEWLKTAPKNLLEHYHISLKEFNDYKVFPRLFFGEYLHAQFNFLLKKAKQIGLTTHVHTNCTVMDVKDNFSDKEVLVTAGDGKLFTFTHVVVCTGHNWPVVYEGKVPNYFDSPYPPSKLTLQINYPVAIRGGSLTAIDAIRTLARQNGCFDKKDDGMLTYKLSKESKGFKMIMHSRHGMLPGVRFHLTDSHLSKNSVLSNEDVQKNMNENDGFLSLDYVFEKNFKEPFKENDPQMYKRIKEMTMENFVEEMMALRENLDAFTLLKAEYAEAEKSIERKQSVYWKEMLAVLSFAMNYPAKHFSAEDMMRLQKVLMPLISIVIAFVPQSSCREMIALHNAGILNMVAIGEDGSVEPLNAGGAVVHFTDDGGNKKSYEYRLFIDAIGQPHLSYDQVPFPGLLKDKIISSALIKFRSAEEGKKVFEKECADVKKYDNGDYYLSVPGITINDHFQIADKYGSVNPRIFMMAVPYIAGYNPDYSGLDFCEAASGKIIEKLVEQE